MCGIALDNPACSAELDFDEIRDDINALFKAQISAVKAQIVVPCVYPFSAGVSLVVCGAFLVGGGDGLECFLAVYYALYLRGVQIGRASCRERV